MPDSLIGYISGTLTDPTLRSDSLVGFSTGTLSDPLSSDSLIGYYSGTLVDPIALGDSLIGFKTATLRKPHHPVGVDNGPGYSYVPILSFDGTRWR